MRRFAIILSGFLLLFSVAGAAAQDFEALARRLPESVNAIALVDLKAIMESPLAQREKWPSKTELINLPSSVQRLALGGQFNPAAGMHQWRFGVAELGQPIGMAALARKWNGTTTTVADRPAVFGQDNISFVQLGANLLAVNFDSNRQELSRWIRVAEANTTLVLGGYLRDFVRANAAAQLRFALDTSDLFDPDGVKRALTSMPSLSGQQASVDAAARLVSTMRGMTFTVRVNNDIRGSLRLDFGSDAARLGNLADALLRDVLKEQGIYLPDFDNFKTEVRGNSIFFEGPLTEAGLRQVVTGLLDLQQSMQTLTPESAASPGDSGMDSAVARSRRYFNGVVNLIEDLRRQLRTLQNSREFAHWYEHTARRIDQLPVVGVDPQLVEFGATTADKLRAMGTSVRGVRIDVNRLASHRRSSSTVAGTAVAGTAWGYGFGAASGGAFFNNNFADVAQAQSQVIAAGAQDRVAVWSQIDGAIGQVRREMSRKFGVEF